MLGDDNAHGDHHRHFMGLVERCEFESYEATVARFQQEWVAIVADLKGRLP